MANNYGGIPLTFMSKARMLGGNRSAIFGLGRNSSLFGISSRSLFG